MWEVCKLHRLQPRLNYLHVVSLGVFIIFRFLLYLHSISVADNMTTEAILYPNILTLSFSLEQVKEQEWLSCRYLPCTSFRRPSFGTGKGVDAIYRSPFRNGRSVASSSCLRTMANQDFGQKVKTFQRELMKLKLKAEICRILVSREKVFEASMTRTSYIFLSELTCKLTAYLNSNYYSKW